MAETTPSRTDLMYEILYNPGFVPLPSPKVHVKTTVSGGKSSYLMKNDTTGIYYEPDDLTIKIWNMIDGKRSLKQIVEEMQQRESQVREDVVLQTLLFFAEDSILVATSEPPRKKRFKVVSAFEMDFTLIYHSNKFLQSIHNKIHPILKRPLLWVTAAFIILNAALFAVEFVSIFGDKSSFQIAGSSVVGFFFYYFVALAPVIAVHEIAHGLALVHYGGKPGEMGTGLFYFGPMFYTETTDAWGLEKKHRMMVYFAGNITTLLIGSIVAFTLFFVKFPPPASLILMMVAFYCFDMALFNFAPPFETDGYYILSDALNMPNLRRESYGYVGSLVGRLFGSKPKTTEITRRKKWIYVGYALFSMGWIAFIVFQTSLFLSYMSQDVAIVLSDLSHALLTSQAVSAAAVLIAVLSVLYFGMQVLGYGSLFMAAVKKAFKSPLTIEAIHDRALSVFAYLPPQVPKSLSSQLRVRMEKTANKLTRRFDIKQVGGSCNAVLRIGGAQLAFSQIKDSLKRMEYQFAQGYTNLILSHKDQIDKSIGIYSSEKAKLTELLDRLAAESASAGNSGAPLAVKACKKKQRETILYLLSSAFGTVWTIEVQPAHGYTMQRDIVPAMLLEDLTLTDLYGDCEDFKKRTVYGFDSLAKLSEDTDIGLKESLAQPQEYQVAGAFEPVKSRFTFVGRTEQLEKKLDLFAPYFVAVIWSGHLDNLLTETCCTLDALNRVRVPTAKAMREMSIGELAVLTNDLSELAENQELVNRCIQRSEGNLLGTNQGLQELQDAILPCENFQIGLLRAAFNVNVENLAALPARIKYFKQEWKKVCKKIDRISEHVKSQYEKRSSEIGQKKRAMLRTYPPLAVISALLATLSFFPPFSTFQIPIVALALVIQGLYVVALYRMYRSFRTVSRYASESFGHIHLLLLAWTQAIYPYVTTGDVLAPQRT